MAVIRFFLPFFLATASLTHAGVVITLVPTPDEPANEPGQVIGVEVFAQLDVNSPASVRVRGMQFNLSDSDPALQITPVTAHAATAFTDGLFWDFSSTSVCMAHPEICGNGYYTNSDLVNQNLSAVWHGGEPSSSHMISLTQATPRRVGVLELTMPFMPGMFILDLLNADEADYLNHGSWLIFGFDDEGSDDPRTEWSAHNGSMVGGRHVFYIIPEPATLTLLLLGTAFLTTKARRKNGGVQ